jgi:hypothetical protein
MRDALKEAAEIYASRPNCEQMRRPATKECIFLIKTIWTLHPLGYVDYQLWGGMVFIWRPWPI